MINVFMIRKYASLLVPALLSSVTFAVGMVFGGWWIAMGLWAVVMIIGVLFGNMLLRNPFTAMLEGKGILAFDFCSPGIIRSFIVALDHPYVKGKTPTGQKVEDIFDRNAVFNFTPPQSKKASANVKASKIMEGKKKNGLRLELSEEEVVDARFQFNQYPVFIYNSQNGSFITKSYLTKLENETMTKHTILYASKRIEELAWYLKNFGRMIVEQFKPEKGGLWANPWVRTVVIFFVIILIGFVIYKLFVAGGGSALKSAASGISGVQGATVVPR